MGNNVNEKVGRNLSTLFRFCNISQNRAADILEVSTGALSGYVHGRTSPSIEFLSNCLETRPFCEDASFVSIYDLLKDPDEFEAFINDTPAPERYTRKDMAGSYMVYFFDQSKEYLANRSDYERHMRYGVIALYETSDPTVSKQGKFKAKGKFFKDKNRALELHKSVSTVFKSKLNTDNDNVDVEGLENGINDEFRGKECYNGVVDFREKHIFIDLESNEFSDHALFALYSTPKRADSDYIGGVASLSSVSRGKDHSPCAQKAFVSRYALSCSDEEIANVIRLNPINISLDEEAKEMYEFFNEITSEKFRGVLDDHDQLNLFTNRLERLVSDYLKNNLNSVGSVSTADDAMAYEMIKHEITKQ